MLEQHWLLPNRSYILNQGEILADGSSDQLRRNQVVKETLSWKFIRLINYV